MVDSTGRRRREPPGEDRCPGDGATIEGPGPGCATGIGMMANNPRYFITTAIDYPNSRPHIGTAFEKIGADVQARFRRMEGDKVHFLMGNDENTIKVPQRARELAIEPKQYVDEMAVQFQDVWRALDISYDDFIQTSEERHHRGCQKFIQAVFDAGDIYKGVYTGHYS